MRDRQIMMYAVRYPERLDAPRDSGDNELEFLRRDLDAYYASAQKSSVSAALRENTGTGDFAADLDYLRALQETLEKGHE